MSRSGYFKKQSAPFLLLLLFGVGLLFLAGCSTKTATGQQEQPPTLFAYAGANLKDPVTELAESYTQKTGVKIELSFNSSGAHLSQIDLMKKGDIYMPGGMHFVEQAQEKGHVDRVMGPIANHTPVIITPKGNPAGVRSLEDLANEGVELLIPDTDASALGKAIHEVFQNAGLTAAIEKNILSSLETPPKVLIAIAMGQGNAGIVEYSNAFKEKEKIEVIAIDPKINVVEQIPIASLVYATDKELVMDFMHYIVENGPATFRKYGFKTD